MIQFSAARHSNDINVLSKFYTTILHLEILGKFDDHDGYNGAFLGIKGEPWRLEFSENSEKTTSIYDEEDLWVIYVNNKQFDTINKALAKYRIKILEPKNPYWKENGVYFKDPDNFGVVVVKKNN